MSLSYNCNGSRPWLMVQIGNDEKHSSTPGMGRRYLHVQHDILLFSASQQWAVPLDICNIILLRHVIIELPYAGLMCSKCIRWPDPVYSFAEAMTHHWDDIFMKLCMLTSKYTILLNIPKRLCQNLLNMDNLYVHSI